MDEFDNDEAYIRRNIYIKTLSDVVSSTIPKQGTNLIHNHWCSSTILNKMCHDARGRGKDICIHRSTFMHHQIFPPLACAWFSFVDFVRRFLFVLIHAP